MSKTKNTLLKFKDSFFELPLLAKLFFLSGFIFIVYLGFYQLGLAPLDNWDEAWYADVTRTMLRTNEYIVMYWNNMLWLDKPPLYMWLSALVSSVIGINEFSVRVPSALSGILLVLLVMWFCYKKYGLVPAFLAFVTLSLNNVFLWRMRSGNMDTLPALLIFITFLLQLTKHKYKYIFLGILFGLIFLTRASLVVYPLAIFILSEIIFERKKIMKNYKNYLVAFGIPLVMVGIWLLSGTLKAGSAFYEFFLFRSDHGVASLSLSHFKTDYFMYAYYALQRRFFFVFLLGVIFAVRYIKDKTAFMLLLYGIALFIQLSFTERSNNWYLVPSMAFWSVLIAYATFHVLKIVKNNFIVAFIIFSAAAFLGYRAYVVNILPVLNTTGITGQMESSNRLNALTKKGDMIVRLDHLYPATIYYSERQVLSSPEGSDRTENEFISRANVVTRIQKKEIRWIVGKSGDIQTFKATIPTVKVKEIKVNNDETILYIL